MTSMRMTRRALVALFSMLAVLLPMVPAAGSDMKLAPDNDNFAQAREIAALPFQEELVVADASTESGEPTPTCAGPERTLWYRFTSSDGASVRIETSFSNHDTAVAIYRGTDLGDLTESACEGTFVGYIGGPGRVQFTPEAGVTYHVQAISIGKPSDVDDDREEDLPVLTISVKEVPRPASLGTVEEFTAVGEDGTPLHGHLYLPEGDGPFATVLEYSPYWNTFYIESEAAAIVQEDRSTLWSWLGPFLDAGYAVALVNIRGSGISGGCAQWGSHIDAADAARVIETLAAREWSNGKVGMIGLSFPAWMQYLAISAAPEPLKAAIPASGIIDFHSYITRNGAVSLDGVITPTFFEATYLRGLLMPFGWLDFAGKPFVPDDSVEHIACPRYVEDQWEGLEAYTNGDRNAYWNERDLRDAIAQTDVAIFATSGTSPYGEGGHIMQFEGLWDLMSNDRRLLLGDWSHDPPRVDDFPDESVEWFDHYLRGGPPVKERGLVEYQDTDGDEHTANHWPPHGPRMKLFLSDGTLVPDQNAVESSQQTFESLDGDAYAENCPGRALYVSPPLAEEVLLAGNAEIQLTVTSDQTDGNLAAFLWHTDGVAPCGELTADGLNLMLDELPYPDEVMRALTDLRHPTPGAPGAKFPIGVPTPVTISSHPFAVNVPAGERLVLTVAGGSYELAPEFRKPRLTVTTGRGLDSWISLPVIDGKLRFE